MKVTINKKLGVGYVQFKRAKVAKTVKVRKNILIDLDAQDNVLGIEILALPEFKKSRTTKKRAA